MMRDVDTVSPWPTLLAMALMVIGLNAILWLAWMVIALVPA